MANGDSVQKRLTKVRAPRVQMTYDVEIGDALENKELPFVVGVVGDFGGNSDVEQKRLKDRKFVSIDNGNFDEVLGGVEPVARFQVPNQLSGDDSSFAVELRFKAVSDFRPESVVQQVEPLRRLLEARTKLADLRNKLAGNDKLEDILTDVLNNTDSVDNSSQPWVTQAIDSGAGLADMEAERRRNSAAFNAALLADAEYCLAMLGELERVVDERLGRDGPGFSAARECLQSAIHSIAPHAGRRGEGGMEEVEGMADGLAFEGRASGAQPGGPRLGGALRNRAQALAQLRLVADFFRNTEPHSPVAYLADKAASWGEMPLHVWLRAVVKDPGALAGLEELLGAADSAS